MEMARTARKARLSRTCGLVGKNIHWSLQGSRYGSPMRHTGHSRSQTVVGSKILRASNPALQRMFPTKDADMRFSISCLLAASRPQIRSRWCDFS